MRVGIDAHKRTCVASIFESDMVLEHPPKERLTFKTTRGDVNAFMARVAENSVVVVESSTTGKVISRMLTGKCEVHLVAPPERKPAVKTDRRDSERIVREDALGYLRRCYMPSPYVEDMRFIVAQQMRLAENISRVKSQVHSLLERNMLQSAFEDISDIFGVEGLGRLSTLARELPGCEAEALAMHLEELKLYISQHRQIERQVARVAESDEDCQLLLTHPGIAQFTAVAIKARIGEVERFPSKKHLCSYAGVVPRSDNTGEYVSEHASVKHGDDVLKYALTCAVRGAVKAGASTAVKRFYLKQVRKGKAPQDAEVAAARKLACIIWRVLTSRRSYVEEDRYLTARKRRETFRKARAIIPEAAKPEQIPKLIEELKSGANILEQYPERARVTVWKEDR